MAAANQPGQPHPVQPSRDVVGLGVTRLDVDQQPLRRVVPGEPRHVGVRTATEVGQRLDATADQPSAHRDRLVGVQARPRARRVQRVGVTGRVGHPVGVRARPVPRCRALRDRVTGPEHRDVEPRPQGRGHDVRRVHQVVPVQGGDTGAQGDRGEQRRDVGVAHEPRRLGRRDGVPVQQRQEVDRQLTSPRRDHRPDRGVGQHPHQLVGTLGGGALTTVDPSMQCPTTGSKPLSRSTFRQTSSRGRRATSTPLEGDVTPMRSPGCSGAG